MVALPESPRWLATGGAGKARSTPLRELFSAGLIRFTLVGIAVSAIPMIGAWSAGKWMIPWADQVAGTVNRSYKAITQGYWALGAVIGSFTGAQLAAWLGRRRSYALISFGAVTLTLVMFLLTAPLRPEFHTIVFAQGLVCTLYFGWNHPWSSHWGTQPHAPTAPVSGPLFEGSGTGIVFGNSPHFPQEYRGVSAIADGSLRFGTECRLKTSTGEPLCLMTSDFTLMTRPNGWMLVWNAAFHADQRPIVFGDQEEMGFGARVATPFTEKSGGVIRSSSGKKTAKETWGQPAMWCDYSGTGEKSGGIMLMASPDNFRESWWHNRDYGVFVANPFGREAMRQGARSEITVAEGETLRIKFGAIIHGARELDTLAEYNFFINATTDMPESRSAPEPKD